MLDPVVPAAGLLEAVFGNDFRHAGGEAALDQRIGRVHRDADRVVVHLLDGLEAAKEFAGGSAPRGLFAHEAFGAEGEDDVVSGEVGAVLELHAAAQLEFNRFRRNALPGFRQARMELARLLIGANERFIDGIGDAVHGIVVDALGLDGGRQLLNGNNHVVGARLGGRGKGAGGGKDERANRILLHNFCFLIDVTVKGHQTASDGPRRLRFARAGIGRQVSRAKRAKAGAG